MEAYLIREHTCDGYKIILLDGSRDRVIFDFKNNEWISTKQGHAVDIADGKTRTYVYLPIEVLKSLASQFYNLGFLPEEVKAHSSVLAEKDKHLQDMRTITFNKLGIKKVDTK